MQPRVTRRIGFPPFGAYQTEWPQWVETTHWPAAAFGKRTFNGGFAATNPRTRPSLPDPMEPVRNPKTCRSTSEFTGLARLYAQGRWNDGFGVLGIRIDTPILLDVLNQFSYVPRPHTFQLLNDWNYRRTFVHGED